MSNYNYSAENFFTKDDICEFADTILDQLDSLYNDEFSIIQLYIDGNNFHIEVESGEELVTAVADVTIDMRKISSFNDINKYFDTICDTLSSELDRLTDIGG